MKLLKVHFKNMHTKSLESIFYRQLTIKIRNLKIWYNEKKHLSQPSGQIKLSVSFYRILSIEFTMMKLQLTKHKDTRLPFLKLVARLRKYLETSPLSTSNWVIDCVVINSITLCCFQHKIHLIKSDQITKGQQISIILNLMPHYKVCVFFLPQFFFHLKMFVKKTTFRVHCKGWETFQFRKQTRFLPFYSKAQV